MAAAPGPLQQAGDAFRTADLEHAFNRQKVDTQIKTGGRDDRFELALLEAQFDPRAHVAVERAVMKRDATGPIGPRREQRLVPLLGLRAHVREHERAGTAGDLAHDRRDHLQSEMAAPRKQPRALRQQGIDHDLLVELALHEHAVVRVIVRMAQRAQGVVEIAERCR